MKNFIFKSSDVGLIKNVFNKLLIIQSELRHARSDHVLLLNLVNKLVVNQNLQKQVDEYFDDEDKENIPEDSKDLD